jgi:hypothetical protein
MEFNFHRWPRIFGQALFKLYQRLLAIFFVADSGCFGVVTDVEFSEPDFSGFEPVLIPRTDEQI